MDRANLQRSLDGVRKDFAGLGATLGSALKFDVAAAGVELLPAMATGLASVAQALQQVSQAGLVVPGILAGAGATAGTLALGLNGVKDAWTAAGKAAGGSAAEQQKAAEAMAKLAPNAREFVQAMLDLKPAFKDLQTGTQQALFAGMSDSIRTLVARDLPSLKNGMSGIATSLNRDFKQLFASLGSDSSRGFLDRILGNTGIADGQIKAAIDPLVHAIGTLSAAGSDTLPRLADAVGNIADRFDHFISAADKDGRLKKWMDEGLAGMTQLGHIALNLGKSFTDITKAVGGQGLLLSLDQATQKLERFLGSSDGQQKLVRFFQEGRDEFRKWEPIVANLAKTLPSLFEAAKQTAETFRPIIKDITETLAKNPQLVKDIAEGFLLWKTVIEPIASVAKAIRGLTEMYSALKLMINGTRDAAILANGAMAASGGAAGAGGAAAGAGGAAAGAGAIGLGTGAAIIGGALAAGVGAAALEAKIDEHSVPVGGDPAMAGSTRPYTEADVANLTVPVGAPKPGSPEAELTMSGLAVKGDPGAKWVVSTQNKFDQMARYAWLMNHAGDDKPGFKPPADYLPQQGAPPPPGLLGGGGSFAAGGPTPHGSGPLPDGGYQAVIHPSEYVANATGRRTLGDAFLAAANQGRVDPSLLPHFDVGGPGDQNPADVGPKQVAPSPMGGGGGILNNVLGGIASGVQGPIGNAISFGSSLAGGGQSGGGGGGIPGIWGLMQAGGNPQAMQAWGSQTANWTANFAANTLMSAGQTFLGGILGGLGLGNSILSPSNPYNQAAMQTAGFFTGSQSPFMAMGGGGSGLDTGATTDGSSIQIPTVGTAGGGGTGGAVRGVTPDFDAIAAKESGGDWHINTGNGFFGGLQFTQSSWEAAGGTAFAARADLATPEQQKQVGSKLYQMQGAGAWPNTFTAKPSGWPGSQTGGTLVPGQWGGVDAIAAQFGLRMTSGFRDPNGPAVAGVAASKSYHGSGRAHDFGGTPEQRLAFANFMVQNYGSQLKELIYDAPGFNSTINNGRVVGPFGSFYTLGQAGDHSDHVHVAFDAGGYLQPGISTVANFTGKPEAVLTHQQTQAYQTVAQHLESKPSIPQVPDAQHLQPPPQTQAPTAAAQPPPPPPAQTPAAPQTTPGSTPQQSLSPTQVAAAPTSTDHNLKAIDTGIDSGAQAIGQAVSTAIGVAGGAAGGVGGGAAGAIGPYVAGLIKQGGDIAKNVVNVGSSLLVGSVPGSTGTQDLAAGMTLRSPQNVPNVAPTGSPNNYTFNGMDIPKVFQELDLREAQQHQSALAARPRISA